MLPNVCFVLISVAIVISINIVSTSQDFIDPRREFEVSFRVTDHLTNNQRELGFVVNDSVGLVIEV